MFGGIFDTESIYKNIKDKEALQLNSNFWNDTKLAEKTLSDLKALKAKIEPWQQMLYDIKDIEAMYDLAQEEVSEATENELASMVNILKDKFDKQSVLGLLSGEVDKNGAYISVHAGAGGTEACDWANMLLRMYSRWCERHNYKIKIVDMVEAEGGIKSVTLQVEGDYVYGYLKSEAGVHRLVRISPFDANARRHTSFSSIYVFPILDDTITVDIRPEDLRVDTFRSGGAGGQHVNKTDSAVRFTHLPTGIVVQCDGERSQIMNRQTAMNMLRARLYEYYKQKKKEENSKFATEKKGISFGNQIRSYVFQPYTMVKDHRTKYQVGNIQKVMDGEIDDFIESYLMAQLKGVDLSNNGESDL